MYFPSKDLKSKKKNVMFEMKFHHGNGCKRALQFAKRILDWNFSLCAQLSTSYIKGKCKIRNEKLN